MNILVIVLTLLLASCSQNSNNSKYRGRIHEVYAEDKVHSEYLNCYSLKQIDKQICTNRLKNLYIDKNKRKDKEYVRAFQFESEKQGFKHFINNQGLPCERIDNGPKFKAAKKAYLILCKPNHEYFMRFDYQTRKWSLI